MAGAGCVRCTRGPPRQEYASKDRQTSTFTPLGGAIKIPHLPPSLLCSHRATAGRLLCAVISSRRLSHRSALREGGRRSRAAAGTAYGIVQACLTTYRRSQRESRRRVG